MSEGAPVEWLLAALAGGGLVAASRLLWDRRTAARHRREELDGVRLLADEDVTKLGEELQRLDAEVAALDEGGRVDYQKALDAYESAQRLVPRIRASEEISKVTDTLSAGRYAVACVQARLDGRPLPELRVPCFFNPQHGPSVRDVLFTPPGRGTRSVPACAQDAARLEAGEKPEVRKVKVGSRLVPYWEAGAAYLPYGEGYFVTGALAGASLGWAFDPQVIEYTSGFSGDYGGGLHGDGGVGDGGFGDGGGGGDGGM